RAVDVLAPETAGPVAVGLVAGAQVVGDLFHRPLADPGVHVGRDVRHRLILGPLGVAGKETAVVGGHGHGARRGALTAVGDRAHQVFAPRHPGPRRGGGRLLTRGGRRE